MILILYECYIDSTTDTTILRYRIALQESLTRKKNFAVSVMTQAMKFLYKSKQGKAKKYRQKNESQDIIIVLFVKHIHKNKI